MPKKTADSALKPTLSSQARALASVGAPSDAALLSVVSDYCEPILSTKYELDTSSQIRNGSATEGTSARAALLVADLKAVIEPSGKRVVCSQLDRLAVVLKEHGHMSLEDVIKLVARTASPPLSLDEQGARLKGLLGEPEFTGVLEGLLKHSSIKQQDMLTIARLMGLNPSPKLSKPKVGLYILGIHSDLATLKAKNAAMRGRSAA